MLNILTETEGNQVKPSFYQYVLTFRGEKNDPKADFAEAAFDDHSFPKAEEDFSALSKYIEENDNDQLKATVFDELWQLYEEKFSE